LGRNPVSARLSCFIGFIYLIDSMTMPSFSQITLHDGHLCRLSLDNALLRELPQLELDPSDNALWTMAQIELTDTELQESEIEMAFNRVCKAIDDSSVPILSMIYGGLTVEDAIAAYEKAQAISLADWRRSISPWQNQDIEEVICH